MSNSAESRTWDYRPARALDLGRSITADDTVYRGGVNELGAHVEPKRWPEMVAELRERRLEVVEVAPYYWRVQALTTHAQTTPCPYCGGEVWFGHCRRRRNRVTSGEVSP